MDFAKMKEILEKIKDETLVPIDKTDPLYRLVNINNEGVNHGVMQMYYKILREIYKAESEEFRKKVSA